MSLQRLIARWLEPELHRIQGERFSRAVYDVAKDIEGNLTKRDALSQVEAVFAEVRAEVKSIQPVWATSVCARNDRQLGAESTGDGAVKLVDLADGVSDPGQRSRLDLVKDGNEHAQQMAMSEQPPFDVVGHSGLRGDVAEDRPECSCTPASTVQRVATSADDDTPQLPPTHSAQPVEVAA